ncbi:MAG: hypothetical protein Kow00120_09910 [Anaerolineae bacterium]
MSERTTVLKPTYDRSWALVVGIDRYKSFDDNSLPPLRTSVHGARAVASILRDRLGFETTLLVDDAVVRREVLGTLNRIAREAKPDDRFLFYFAGHGLTRTNVYGGEVGYLTLYDTQPGDDIWTSALKMDDVLEQADFIKAKHILFILDACFSGLAFGRAVSVEQQRLAKDFLTFRAVQAISAGRAGEVVADGGGPDGRHSIFTWNFLQGIQDGTLRAQWEGLIRAEHLGPWLQDQVRKQARGRQTPQFGHLPGSGRGDFIFDGWELDLDRVVAPVGGAPEHTRSADAPTPPQPQTIALRGAAQDFEPDWVEIPAGAFKMGSAQTDWMAFDDEMPQHDLTLPEPYLIARAPITNAQYAAFVNATGRRAPRHWRDTPPTGQNADVPVVWVSWHDAVAYCKWLTDAMRDAGRLPPGGTHVVRLPTEPEWERAARGDDGRRYPWGDDAPDSSRANFGSNENGPTPVGSFSPQGDSPYGCQDMAGNVWEWTLSLKETYPYEPHDGREETSKRGRRALRGGAFNASERNIRVAGRNWHYPEERDETIGFRVVLVRA